MNKKVREALGRLREGLAELYSGRLKGVYLFGSHSRGDAREESDVDVLIVLDKVRDYRKEIENTSKLVGDLSLEYDLSISRVFVSEKRWREDMSMFFLNVREEAVRV